MRLFFRAWQPEEIYATLSRKSPPVGIVQTVSEESADTSQYVPNAGNANSATVSRNFTIQELASVLSLPWSHYVLLLKVEKPEARRFYEAEALRNGWTVRQLDRQITTLFYERMSGSRNKRAMLKKGALARPEEELTPEDAIKDPLVLEFLGLKDEYSESNLEEALIREIETLLLELGGDFTFVGRQKRLRIGDVWYRIDLLFFHRRLRCLVVIDLKLGKFTHADAGQMQLYLSYAREHWTNPGENPPRGFDSLHPERCGRRPLRAGRIAEQGPGGRVSHSFARREGTGIRTRIQTASDRIANASQRTQKANMNMGWTFQIQQRQVEFKVADLYFHFASTELTNTLGADLGIRRSQADGFSANSIRRSPSLQIKKNPDSDLTSLHL
jgi:predicted nuclease of restriction endonuclease-like (RecB) superfamily